MCIPLYNRGEDISKLLYNINDIYNSIDKNILNINVIIGDYNSTDIDFNEIISKISVPVKIIQIKGTFNLSKSLQICSDSVKKMDELIMHLDADTVFEGGSEFLIEICNKVIKRKTYYCPIVSTEYKPRGWKAKFNEKIYIPTSDHGGRGFIIIYNSDYKKSKGFLNSKYMSDRGEIWGGHENILRSRFKFLKIIRCIESNIWLRNHLRTKSRWFSRSR